MPVSQTVCSISRPVPLSRGRAFALSAVKTLAAAGCLLSMFLLSSCVPSRSVVIPLEPHSQNKMSKVAVFVSASVGSAGPLWSSEDEERSKTSAIAFSELISQRLAAKHYTVVASMPALSGMDAGKIRRNKYPGSFFVFPDIDANRQLKNAVVAAFDEVWILSAENVGFGTQVKIELDTLNALQRITGADTICFVFVEGVHYTKIDSYSNWACCISLIPIALLFGGGGEVPPPPGPDGWWADFTFVDARDGSFLWRRWYQPAEEATSPSATGVRQALDILPVRGAPFEPGRCSRRGKMVKCW